jgi:carboxymethylenebutenolidase
VAAFEHELDGAGVLHDVVTYPGAPHSFFDVRAAEYTDASADAGARVLGFGAAPAGI